MDLNIKFVGFLLIAILALSYAQPQVNTTSEDSDDYFEDDYTDYTYEEDSNQTKSSEKSESESPTSPESPPPLVEPAIIDRSSFNSTEPETGGPVPSQNVELPPSVAENEEPVALPACPEHCSCTDNDQFVNCSSVNQIPSNLPINTIQLSLNFNNITSITTKDLEHLVNLRVLNISHNQIDSIDKETFRNLKSLEIVDLSSNLIKSFDVNLFNDTNLKVLNLAYNPLELNEGPFLTAPYLEELNMANCNLTNLPNEFSTNLASLEKLNLANNLFEEEFNSDSLMHLTGLQFLTLTDGISEESTRKICEYISTIDTILFTTFRLSCFNLMSDTTFEDSTSSLIEITATTAAPSKPTKKATPANGTRLTGDNRSQDAVNDQPGSPSLTTTTPESKVPQKDIDQSVKATGTTKGVNGTNTSDDPKQTKTSGINTNNILIGIIIVAVIGLIIGIICRRDCCGIKTKCCRTKHNESMSDRNRHEETPLNKIVSQD